MSDAKFDKNYNASMLGYDSFTDEIALVKSNAAGDAILVEATVMVNDYKTAISGLDTTPNYLEDKIVAGANITITKLNPLGNEQLEISATGATVFYQTMQDAGVSQTQRSVLNFVNYFTLSDVATKTTVNIDTLGLGGDSILISTLTSNTTFLTNIANSTVFVNALVANTTFVTNLANSTVFVNALIANTTFTTNLANNLNFINTLLANSTFITNISGLVAVVTDGVTITGDGTIANPLVAVGGAGGSASEVVSPVITQATHGFSVGELIYCDLDDHYALAIALSTSLFDVRANVIGKVITVPTANTFTYAQTVLQDSTGTIPSGTPGQALWLSATTPGAVTATKPSTVNSTYLNVPVGTLINSASTMDFHVEQGSNQGGGSNATTVLNNALFGSNIPTGVDFKWNIVAQDNNTMTDYSNTYSRNGFGSIISTPFVATGYNCYYSSFDKDIVYACILAGNGAATGSIIVDKWSISGAAILDTWTITTVSPQPSTFGGNAWLSSINGYRPQIFVDETANKLVVLDTYSGVNSSITQDYYCQQFDMTGIGTLINQIDTTFLIRHANFGVNTLYYNKYKAFGVDATTMYLSYPTQGGISPAFTPTSANIFTYNSATKTFTSVVPSLGVTITDIDYPVTTTEELDVLLNDGTDDLLIYNIF